MTPVGEWRKGNEGVGSMGEDTQRWKENNNCKGYSG